MMCVHVIVHCMCLSIKGVCMFVRSMCMSRHPGDSVVVDWQVSLSGGLPA